MVEDVRALIAWLLTIMLLLPWAGCSRQPRTPPQPPQHDATTAPLLKALELPYLELFAKAPSLHFPAQQINLVRGYLQKGQDYCVAQFKKRADDYDRQVQQDQNTLKQRSTELTPAERKDLHCRIQANRIHESRARVRAKQAIPVAYENERAKLELIEKWPAQLRLVQQAKADGSYRRRPNGNVEDIGFRNLAPGQADDIRMGQEAIRDLKQRGLMPDELQDAQIQTYARDLALKVARSSDLTIPLHIVVLNSKEINAFALPGGFLYVNSGLLNATDDESQLVGVIAHEIAHDADRHARKLMKKATISQIAFQAAQVAALLLTGGAVGPGLYYALQYGFQGLGLVLSLNLLGVSRAYELQADQLGIQYAWKAGYDPEGFTRFFDKMATREGYVLGASWFRTHPPFYQRMVDAQREIMFLPAKPGLATQSSAFLQMKRELAAALRRQPVRDAGKAPSLLGAEPGCTLPPEEETQPGQTIRTVCSLPGQMER